MEREGPEPSLHGRLMTALVRGAEAQERTRAIVAAQLAADKSLAAALASSRLARRQRARERDVRNQTHR